MNKTLATILFLVGAGIVVTGITMTTSISKNTEENNTTSASHETLNPNAIDNPVGNIDSNGKINVFNDDDGDGENEVEDDEDNVGSGTVTTPAPSPAPTPTPTPATKSYTLAQVATHNSKTSCWSVVRSNVYDLTPWISQHPGGQSAIVSMCGKDSTAAFEDQHGGQRRPENELAGFEIGVLVN